MTPEKTSIIDTLRNGRLARLAAALVLALIVCGCTSRFVYDNADWWLNWYIDDYIQFNRGQQHSVDRYLDQQMLWHRRNQLPLYDAFLQQIKQDCAGELTVPLVRQRFSSVYQFWHDFVSEAMPGLTTMLGQLDQKQVQAFSANIEKEAQEFEAEYVRANAQELAQEHQDDTEKNLKKWLGPLSDTQREIISRWAHAMQNVYPVSLAQRKRWQAQLELALRERDQQALFEKRIHALFVTPSEFWNADYKAMMDANELLTAQMLVDIHRSLSITQRKRLFATLDGYISDIRQLQQSR